MWLRTMLGLLAIVCSLIWVVQSRLYSYLHLAAVNPQADVHAIYTKQLDAPTSQVETWCTLDQIGAGAWNRSVLRPAPYCCFQNSRQTGCEPHPNITRRMRRNQGCGNGCNCDMDAQYGPVWVPSAKCRLDEWDARKFCEHLGNKRLVFVGDSIADQFHLVLFNMLHEEKRSLDETCADQVVFRASDTFHFFRGDRGQRLDAIIASEMLIASQLGQQLMFIVCIGPHLYRKPAPRNVAQVLVSNYTTLIQYARSQFALNELDFRFIPVTPVHACTIERNGTMQQWNGTEQYHYPYIPAMNQALYRLLPKEWILPIFDALDQRPDAHNWSDCMHFCMPGALQILPIFLLHLLMIDKL